MFNKPLGLIESVSNVANYYFPSHFRILHHWGYIKFSSEHTSPRVPSTNVWHLSFRNSPSIPTRFYQKPLFKMDCLTNPLCHLQRAVINSGLLKCGRQEGVISSSLTSEMVTCNAEEDTGRFGERFLWPIFDACFKLRQITSQRGFIGLAMKEAWTGSSGADQTKPPSTADSIKPLFSVCFKN